MLILLTELRRTEAASLRWSNVDLKGKIITLIDTKNRGNHVLPMSDFLVQLFERRSKQAQSEYVFPATIGIGHIVEPRKTMLKVVESSGVDFTLHDLRRTFITTAESLDISSYSLKRLLNHKNSNDVTAGYLVIDVERLRKPMQQITNYILKSMGLIKAADITDMQQFKKEVSNEQTLHLDSAYVDFVNGIKSSLKTAQFRASSAVNTELLKFYWSLGKGIIDMQKIKAHCFKRSA